MAISQVIPFLTLFASFAWAAQINNPTACIDPDTFALQISGEYCGQGQSTVFTVTGDATLREQCFTRSGNPVQGVPKQSTKPFEADFDLDPTGTGCQNFCFLTDPLLPTLNCGRSQEARILQVSYTNVVLEGSNAPNSVPIGTVTEFCESTCDG